MSDLGWTAAAGIERGVARPGALPAERRATPTCASRTRASLIRTNPT